MAGFSDSVDGLQAPDFASGGAKLPEVSGRLPKYSHFRETGTGDWVSIGTAWSSLQCNSPNSPPWPWVVGQFDCGGSRYGKRLIRGAYFRNDQRNADHGAFHLP